MFEPWQKFNAKKATTLMNQHHKTLAREHASLRKLLRQKKGQTPAELAERINALRQTWRKVVKDHTSVSRALIANCCTVNFMNVLDTFVAHSYLGVTCDKVRQTLAEHSPSIGQPKIRQPMWQTTYAPNLSQAKTIRDIERRLSALLRKRYGPTENGGPLTESECQEESELRARYIDMAQQVECPPGYSYGNAREDSDRLHQLHCKRLSPRSAGGGELTAAEDDEEALLTAWVAAYWQSREGRERKRLEELEFRRFSRCNDEEQKELDELRKKYPFAKTESETGRKLRELLEQRSRDHGRTRHRPPD
jgi:hypothetical protein